MTSASLNQMEASRPPAMIQPAETEQEQDIRVFKQEYAEGKKKFSTCADILLRIHKRGDWKSSNLSWGAWAETTLGVTKGYAYSIIQSKNPATEQLKQHYQSQAQVKSNETVTTTTSNVSKTTIPYATKEQEPEKPRIKTATEELAENAEKNGTVDKPPMDLSGCVIPQHLLTLRERRQEVVEAAHWASKLKALFERNQNEVDPLFSHLKQSGNIQTFMTGAASMRSMLAECSPDVVCPQCSGKSQTCKQCWGSGWISEVRWNRDFVKSHDRFIQAEVKRRAANL